MSLRKQGAGIQKSWNYRRPDAFHAYSNPSTSRRRRFPNSAIPALCFDIAYTCWRMKQRQPLWLPVVGRVPLDCLNINTYQQYRIPCYHDSNERQRVRQTRPALRPQEQVDLRLRPFSRQGQPWAAHHRQPQNNRTARRDCPKHFRRDAQTTRNQPSGVLGYALRIPPATSSSTKKRKRQRAEKPMA